MSTPITPSPIMIQNARSRGAHACLAALAACAAVGAAHGETITWTGDGGDTSWHNADNWDLDRVPEAGDEVVVPDMTPDITVTYTGGSTSITRLTCAESLAISGASATLTAETNSTVGDALTLSAGTLDGAGDVTVSGTLTWTGGTMSGSGATVANGPAEISGGTKNIQNGRTLELNAATTWSGMSDLDTRNSPASMIINNGDLDIQDDVHLDFTTGERLVFTNTGTLTKSGGVGVAAIEAVVNNGGSMEVDSGTLSLEGGGSSTGSFSGTGTLEFDGGQVMTLEAASTVTVANVLFDGGTTDILGTYDLSGSATTVSGGTATYRPGASVGAVGDLSITSGAIEFSSGAEINVTSITLSGGTLRGSDTVTSAGALLWTGGTMSGETVTESDPGITVADDSAEISGITKNIQNGRTLELNASTTWSGVSDLDTRNSPASMIVNNGDLDIQDDVHLDFTTGERLVFTNTGTLTKSGGVGVAAIEAVVNNGGSMEVDSGTLSLEGGGSSPGSFSGTGTLEFDGVQVMTLEAASSVTVANVLFDGGTTDILGTYDLAGSATTVSGGTATYRPGASVGAVGDLSITSGAIEFSSGEAVNVTSITLSGGTLRGSDTVTSAGPLLWTGGTMSGETVTESDPGVTVADGSAEISGITKNIQNGRTLELNAATTWSGVSDLDTRNSPASRIVNNGDLDIQDDVHLDFTTGERLVFTNTGTLTKSGGVGVAAIEAVVNNGGSMEVDSGTLSLEGGGSSTGSFSGTGTLEFDGVQVMTLEAASTVTVANVLFDGGTTDILGTYDLSGSTTTVSGGTATYRPGASVGVVGDLSITSGSIEFSSGAEINVTSITISGGTLRGSDTVTSAGPLLWTGGTMSGETVTESDPGVTVADDSAEISGITKNIQNGRTLELNAATTWSGVSDLDTRNSPASTIINNGDLDIQDDVHLDFTSGERPVFTNNGTLTKSGGVSEAVFEGSVTNNGVMVVESGTLDLDFELANFSSLTLTGGTYIVHTTLKFRDAEIVTNAATVVLDGPAAEIVDHFDGDALAGFDTNDAAGSFTITNGRDLTTPVPFSNAGDVVASAGSTFSATGDYIQTSGSTTVDAGTLASTGQVDIQGGSLGGDGTVDAPVTSAGRVHPGLSAGLLNGTSTFDQAGAGELDIEIGGPSAGDTYDVLTVDGVVTLAGALNVTLIGGYEPPAAASYDILTAASISGEFDSVSLPTLADGNCWDVDHGAETVSLTVFSPASITQEPTDEEVCEGAAVAFTVTADGFPAPTYQWRKDGQDLPGETGSSLTIDPVSVEDAGLYDVVVTNECDSVTSLSVTLTVNTSPTITQEPTDAMVCEGDPITLNIAADGSPAPTYQWRRDGQDLPGETGSSLTIDPVSVEDAGSYDVVVTNECDSVTSLSVTLTVNTSPTITQEPTDATICEGDPIILSIAADGSPAPTYQWRHDGQELTGETGSSLTIDPVSVEDAGSYDVVVTNDCDSVTSTAATLTVIPITAGDFDCNGTVNLDDHEVFAGCLLGPLASLAPGCELGDFDGDGDVDLGDFAAFQAAFGG